MAKIYHGIVKKSVLENVQKYGECLFPGPTPDMSGAVSISFFIRKYVLLDIPIVIPGMSRMVGGGVMGRVLKLDEVKFITDEDRRKWPVDFPKLWATELIWPACVVNALKSVRHEEYISEININQMYCRFVAIHKRYLKESLFYADNKIFFLISLICYFLTKGFSHIYESRIKSRINGKLLGKYTSVGGLGSISDVESYLMDLINDFSFDELKIYN